MMGAIGLIEDEEESLAWVVLLRRVRKGFTAGRCSTAAWERTGWLGAADRSSSISVILLSVDEAALRTVFGLE